jgi:hypothetical protein
MLYPITENLALLSHWQSSVFKKRIKRTTVYSIDSMVRLGAFAEAICWNPHFGARFARKSFPPIRHSEKSALCAL